MSPSDLVTSQYRYAKGQNDHAKSVAPKIAHHAVTPKQGRHAFTPSELRRYGGSYIIYFVVAERVPCV